MGLCNVVRCTDCGYERMGFPVENGQAVLVCPECGSIPERAEWWNNTEAARTANLDAKAAFERRTKERDAK